MRKDCVSLFKFFDEGGSVRGVFFCLAHILNVGYSDVSSGVGTRRLESPKNPYGLNVGIYVFVYMYKVLTCIRMLGGGMSS